MVDKLTGFVDKTGKEYSMSDYAKIVGQEATIQSLRQGTINKMVEDGAEIARVSEGQSDNTCKACLKWAGQLVAVAGSYPGIPPLDEAIEEGLFHVNCIHVLESLSEEELRGVLEKLGLPITVSEEEAKA